MIIHKIDNNLTFNTNWISPTKQKILTEGMLKNMEKKPYPIQKMYITGIDFVNKKITKKDFLTKLYYVVNDISNLQEKKLEDAEKIFLEDFSMFFDLYGFNQNKTTKKNILESLEFLS